MKSKFYSLTTLIFLSGSVAFGQITDSLRITYDGTEGGQFCKMQGATKCYMYSGAGTTGPNFAWEHIVGNWGVDDGLGEMAGTGTANEWSFTIHLYDYYSDTANTTNPVHQDSTIYRIGVVFQNGDGTVEGKDDNCNEFFIIDCHTANVRAVDGDNNSFPGLTAEWVQPPSAVDELANVKTITAYPNPASSAVHLSFNSTERIDMLRVNVMDVMGKQVAQLYNGSADQGTHELIWDGTANGSAVENGIYFFVIENGQDAMTKHVMILR